MAGGFWNYALEDPDALAVVDPDGTEYTAAEVAARSHRMVHALRSLGLEVGDTVAAVLPNGINPVTVYLGALESGLYYVPINYRLSAPEVAYILSDSEAKAFITHERFAELAVARPTRPASRPTARFAVGTVPGFSDFDEFLAAQPSDVPSDRTAGAAMHYTSGTTGRPKGVKRSSPGSTPTSPPSSSPRSSGCSASSPGTTTCTSARRRTTTPRSRPSPATR